MGRHGATLLVYDKFQKWKTEKDHTIYVQSGNLEIDSLVDQIDKIRQDKIKIRQDKIRQDKIDRYANIYICVSFENEYSRPWPMIYFCDSATLILSECVRTINLQRPWAPVR